MLTNPKILTLATCATTSMVIFATLNQAAAGKYIPDLNKTRPEFASPTRPISTPSASSTPSTTTSPRPDNPASVDVMRPFTPSISPSIAPSLIAPPSFPPFNPPDAGVQGLGIQPIIPTINTLPGTDRPEFRVPDLSRPSPTP